MESISLTVADLKALQIACAEDNQSTEEMKTRDNIS